MKRAWLWLKQLIAGDPEVEKYLEDEVAEAVLRIQRKMWAGHWRFQWDTVGGRPIIVIHPNLPTLIKLIHRVRGAISGYVGLPVEAKQAPHSNRGVERLLVRNYLADSRGLYRDPEELVKEFIESVIWLTETVREVRKTRPTRADSINGQCTYLYKEIIAVAGVLL